MRLTDITIKKAKGNGKIQKLFDGRGLFLYISPAGKKIWRWKYRFVGKEKLLVIGSYPEISLKEAREKREEAQRLLMNGTDPSEHRKATKSAAKNLISNSFEIIAREWFQKFESTWVPDHSNRIIRRLEHNIFPWIGKKPITEIEAPLLLEVIRRIESRGAIETAHRVLSNCGQVFRYAIQTGRASRDVAHDLKGAIPPSKENHHAAILEPEKIGGLLRAIDGYSGQFIVKCALQLAHLVFVRPGELRHAAWDGIDFETAEWRFIASKTKTPHIVPLATQSLQILKEIHQLTGTGRFVFPSARSNARPMSNNAVLAALRRMGYSGTEMTGNGFRATARTLLEENLGFRADLIEQQLAHSVRDPLGRAYNRTTFLAERKAMMQAWADYLDQLKSGIDDSASGKEESNELFIF